MLRTLDGIGYRVRFFSPHRKNQQGEKTMTDEHTAKIRVLNDTVRKIFGTVPEGFGIPHKIVITAGIAGFDSDTQAAIFQAVREFNDLGSL